MSKRKAVISEHWTEFYDQEAKYAARIDSGAFLILGFIKSILRNNARNEWTEKDTLAHLEYLLKAYDEARGFEPDI